VRGEKPRNAISRWWSKVRLSLFSSRSNVRSNVKELLSEKISSPPDMKGKGTLPLSESGDDEDVVVIEVSPDRPGVEVHTESTEKGDSVFDDESDFSEQHSSADSRGSNIGVRIVLGGNPEVENIIQEHLHGRGEERVSLRDGDTVKLCTLVFVQYIALLGDQGNGSVILSEQDIADLGQAGLALLDGTDEIPLNGDHPVFGRAVRSYKEKYQSSSER